jgi:hypothetical protein
MGLLTRLTVDGKFHEGDLATGLQQHVHVSVTVFGPSWVRATNVALFANGVKIDEAQLYPHGAREETRSGLQGTATWNIPRPKHDVHLVAIATGPAVTAPFWAIPRPYQPTAPHWEGRVIGSTNPVWLDADGDRQFTSSRAYARQLLSRYQSDRRGLVAALRNFDETVAIQSASLSGNVTVSEAR